MLTSIATKPGFNSNPQSRASKDWLRCANDTISPGGIVAANAGLAAARQGDANLEQLLKLYDRASAIVRPTLVAAIARAQPSANIRRSVQGESRLYKLIWQRELHGD